MTLYSRNWTFSTLYDAVCVVLLCLVLSVGVGIFQN